MATELDWAYAAGLLDGEGSFMIRKNKPGRKRRSISYTAVVSCKMTDAAPIEFLVNKFGGLLYQKRVTPAGKKIWEWRLGSRQAVPFLTSLLPYLRIPRRIANVKSQLKLLEVQKGRDKMSHPGTQHMLSLSEAELAAREAIYQEAKGGGINQISV